MSKIQDFERSTPELHAILHELRMFLEYKNKKVDREKAIERISEIEEILIERFDVSYKD